MDDFDRMKALITEEWLKKHEETIKEVIPTEWIELKDLCPITCLKHYQELGIPLATPMDLITLIAYFEVLGIYIMDKDRIRSNPMSIFNQPTH